MRMYEGELDGWIDVAGNDVRLFAHHQKTASFELRQCVHHLRFGLGLVGKGAQMKLQKQLTHLKANALFAL